MPRVQQHRIVTALAGGLVAGLASLALFSDWPQAGRDLPDLRARATEFARPGFVPHPPENPPSPEKIALGERLFRDPRLSVNGKIACASCHDPRLGFADGEPAGRGVTGRRLKRHTPALWNLAWAPALLWDGRGG